MALWIATALTIAFLWLTEIPLGIPGEWTWNRLTAENAADRWLGLLSASLVAAVYLFAGWLGERGIEEASGRGRAWRLAALATASFAWLWALQESAPGIHRLQKAPLVLYAPSTSGYFFEATFRINDVREFLRTYEDRVGEGDVLHFGTHPPGLFLFHRSLNVVCEWSPALTRAVRGMESESAREAFELIEQFPMGAPRTLRDSERASLWLAALLSQALGALTVVPLFLLVRRSCSSRAAWRAATLWPLVPALAIFLPKSDTLYPCVAALFVWCWLQAVRRRCAGLGAAAGLLLAGGMFFTLAFLPAAALAASVSLLELWTGRPAALGKDDAALTPFSWKPWLAGAIAFCAPLIVLWLAFGLNLPAVWAENLRNHAGFYSRFPRTGWKWLLVNPAEATLAVGAPVALLAVAAVWRSVRGEEPARLNRCAALGVAAVWGLLWVTGKNSGEAARLWLPLFPWAVWLAGMTLDRLAAETPSDGRPRPAWSEIAVLQAAVCIATVLRVSGFHFGGM